MSSTPGIHLALRWPIYEQGDVTDNAVYTTLRCATPPRTRTYAGLTLHGCHANNEQARGSGGVAHRGVLDEPTGWSQGQEHGCWARHRRPVPVGWPVRRPGASSCSCTGRVHVRRGRGRGVTLATRGSRWRCSGTRFDVPLCDAVAQHVRQATNSDSDGDGGVASGARGRGARQAPPSPDADVCGVKQPHT